MVFFLLILIGISAQNECNWDSFEQSIQTLQSGFGYQDACTKSLPRWKMGKKFELNAEQCTCLIGYGKPLLEDVDCTFDNDTFLNWKDECAKTFCIVDNPAEFCHCNGDDLRNQWTVQGDNVYSACSKNVEFWNNGGHMYTQPTSKTCKCFHLMQDNGLSLGCKWATTDVSKPWEKAPSMASIASKCLAVEETEGEEDEVPHYRRPLVATSVKSFQKPHEADADSSIQKNLLLLLAIVSTSTIGLICVCKSCWNQNFNEKARIRRQMEVLPSDDEFGLDSEDKCEDDLDLELGHLHDNDGL